MNDIVTGLIIGFGVGASAISAFAFAALRRTRTHAAARLSAQGAMIADMRLELAADKESNRRLRHELQLAHDSRSVGSGDGDDEVARLVSERDRARDEVVELTSTLDATRRKLDDREATLREYRRAVHQIRHSLEGGDRPVPASLAGDEWPDLP